jgi:predicted 2-oxoglutarate/Fe(II)-dependent dioxygenase YbiX
MADTGLPPGDADRRAIDDGIAIAYSLLGTALEFRATAVVEKLAQRFAAAPRVHLAQADLWRRAGRLKEAEAAVQRCLACDPHDESGLRLAAALAGRGMPGSHPISTPSPIRLLRSFFDSATHRRLLDMALRFEPELAPSTVGGINPHANWRRSKVNDTPAAFKTLAMDRIVQAAREAVAAFALPDFAFESVEMQFTAHNDGDFYKAHRDHGEGGMEHRRLTYVYYFNRQPRGFSGGGLALFDTLGEGARYNAQVYSLVEPEDNSLIIFPSSFWHEVQQVSCPSGAYADSRFTLNGWIGVKRLKDVEKGA